MTHKAAQHDTPKEGVATQWKDFLYSDFLHTQPWFLLVVEVSALADLGNFKG